VGVASDIVFSLNERHLHKHTRRQAYGAGFLDPLESLCDALFASRGERLGLFRASRVRHRIGMPLDGGAVAALDLDGAFARLYRLHFVVDAVRGEDPRVAIGFAKRLRDQFGR
jgi:hypothetical protein